MASSHCRPVDRAGGVPGGSLAVTEQGGATQRPVVRLLAGAQRQLEDVGEVGASGFLVHGTRVQVHGGRRRRPLAVDCAHGVHMHHGQRREEDLG